MFKSQWGTGTGRKAEGITPRGLLGSWFQSTGGKISTGWEKDPTFLVRRRKEKEICKNINFDDKQLKTLYFLKGLSIM